MDGFKGKPKGTPPSQGSHSGKIGHPSNSRRSLTSEAQTAQTLSPRVSLFLGARKKTLRPSLWGCGGGGVWGQGMARVFGGKHPPARYGCGFLERGDFAWLDAWQPCEWITAQPDPEPRSERELGPRRDFFFSASWFLSFSASLFSTIRSNHSASLFSVPLFFSTRSVFTGFLGFLERRIRKSGHGRQPFVGIGIGPPPPQNGAAAFLSVSC